MIEAGRWVMDVDCGQCGRGYRRGWFYDNCPHDAIPFSQLFYVERIDDMRVDATNRSDLRIYDDNNEIAMRAGNLDQALALHADTIAELRSLRGQLPQRVMLQVYCAAKYARREQVARFINRLPAGAESTATWVKDEIDFAAMSEQGKYAWAMIDTRDVRRCDVLVYWSDDELLRGGKCVELGMQIGAGRPVVMIGRKEHIFASHSAVTVVRDEDEALIHVASFVKRLRGLYHELGGVPAEQG